jgi:hypothetical protein
MDVSRREISPRLDMANLSREKLGKLYPQHGKCSPGNILGHNAAYAIQTTDEFRKRYGSTPKNLS